MKSTKNLKFGATILGYVVVVGIFFVIGYNCGKIRGAEDMKKVLEKKEVPTVASSSLFTKDEYEVKYTILIDMGEICLYKLCGDEKTLLLSQPISENVYPSADILELKKGIVFYDLQEAKMMFENFIS